MLLESCSSARVEEGFHTIRPPVPGARRIRARLRASSQTSERVPRARADGPTADHDPPPPPSSHLHIFSSSHLPPRLSPRPAFAAQSFSSVVGPNGSGKSNVIDAMLFVFGKRAKQLRLNKVSELIHNSTDFRNLQYMVVRKPHCQQVAAALQEQAQQSRTPRVRTRRVASSHNRSKNCSIISLPPFS